MTNQVEINFIDDNQPVEIELFGPSNSDCGEAFIRDWCLNCAKNEADETEFVRCDIHFLTMCHDTDEPEYPAEWRYNEKGDAICAAFEEIKDDK